MSWAEGDNLPALWRPVAGIRLCRRYQIAQAGLVLFPFAIMPIFAAIMP
jgi:hypothetical protein